MSYLSRNAGASDGRAHHVTFNRTRFQPGMSLPEFLRCFGTEARCEAALVAACWPGGIRCANSKSDAHYFVGHGAQSLFRRNGCRHQTSLTAGISMAHTRLPLTTWVRAIGLISQAKTGLSVLALERQFGVSYPTPPGCCTTRLTGPWPRERTAIGSKAQCRSTTPTSVASTRATSLAAPRKTRCRSWPSFRWTKRTANRSSSSAWPAASRPELSLSGQRPALHPSARTSAVAPVASALSTRQAAPRTTRWWSATSSREIHGSFCESIPRWSTSRSCWPAPTARCGTCKYATTNDSAAVAYHFSPRIDRRDLVSRKSSTPLSSRRPRSGRSGSLLRQASDQAWPRHGRPPGQRIQSRYRISGQPASPTKYRDT